MKKAEIKEVVAATKKHEIVKTALLAAIAILLLIRGNEPQQQPRIDLSSIIPCDKQKCYDEASACAANPENKEGINVGFTCLNPLNCENITYDGETLFVNKKQSKCEGEFEKCTKRCKE